MTTVQDPILIIGKNGQVAQSLRVESENRGLNVTAFGRPEFDLARPTNLTATLEGLPFRAIINAAAYTAVDQAESNEELATQINGISVGILAKICRERGVPFLHLSTDYAFDGEKNGPYLETDPTCPIGAYGRSKVAGEEAALKENSKSLIFRTAWVYSAYSNNFLKTMLRLRPDRKELNVVNDQFGCPTWAMDIASGLLDVLMWLETPGRKKPHPSGIFHMVNSGRTNGYDFTQAIMEYCASKGLAVPKINPIASSEYPTPTKRPQNSALDCRRLKEEFDVELPHWKQSLERCLNDIFSPVQQEQDFTKELS